MDVVRRTGTRELYVVDVNHFPGFHGMRTFPDALASLLVRVSLQGGRLDVRGIRDVEYGEEASVTEQVDEGAREVATDLWEDTDGA